MRAKIKLISYSCAMLMASVLPSQSESLFSKYGMIQNVQNYSLNPAYNPNSPYNNRLPAPVYAMGPSIGTDDCMRIVSDLISIHCSNKNYCANATLSDIRPVIMIQLSRISSGNYATSCGGYIDGEFDKYIASHGGGTQQPQVYLPAQTSTSKAPQIQVKNPYTPQTPDWAIEIQERTQELQDLQSENGTNVYGIAQTDFPTTYADLSFSDRMKNEQIGYEPYKNARAYTELKVESLANYEDRFGKTEKGETLAKLRTDAEKIITEYTTLNQKIKDLAPKAQGFTKAQQNLQTAQTNLNNAKHSAEEVLNTLTRQVRTSELAGLKNTIADAQSKINNANVLINKADGLRKTPELIKKESAAKIKATLETTIGKKDKKDSIFYHLQTFNFGSCTAYQIKDFRKEAGELQTEIEMLQSKLQKENNHDKLIELSEQVTEKATEAKNLHDDILNFAHENQWMWQHTDLFNKNRVEFYENANLGYANNYTGITKGKNNYVIIILPCTHKKSEPGTKLDLSISNESNIKYPNQTEINALISDNNPFKKTDENNRTVYYGANNYVLELLYDNNKYIDKPFIFQDETKAILTAKAIFTSYMTPPRPITYGITLYVVRLAEKVVNDYFNYLNSGNTTDLTKKLIEAMKDNTENTVVFGPMEMYNPAGY